MDPDTNYDKIANVGIKDGKIVIITIDNNPFILEKES
jgi:hypothetical protein